MTTDRTSAETLRRVADALGLSVFDFQNAAANATPVEQTVELLGLWYRLDDNEQRLRLLVEARMLVDRSSIGRTG